MRKSSETFSELADTLCSVACYTTAARRLGLSPATIFRWLADSKKAEIGKSADFKFEWAGEVDYLHRHCGRAVRVQVAAIEGFARHRALHGHREGVFYQGKPSWTVREDIARNGDLDAEPDVLELLYGQRDVYMRDALGNRVQETILHAPSDGLVNMVLKGHLPKIYGVKIESNVSHSGTIGVVVGADGRLRSYGQRPQLEAQTDDFVEGAEASEDAPMQIGLVVGERLPTADLEARYGGERAIPQIAFDDREEATPWATTPAAPSSGEMVSTELEDLDHEDDDVDDDLPEPTHVQAPRPRPRPGVDADMRRHNERIGYGDVEPGGMKIA